MRYNIGTNEKILEVKQTLETILQQILESITQLTEGQAQIIKRLDTIENDTSNIKGQLDENTQIIKALIHRADEFDAKYDCLLTTTATKDLISNLDNKFDVLNNRLFQQEAKILSLVK